MSEQDKLTPLDVLKRDGWSKGWSGAAGSRCIVNACDQVAVVWASEASVTGDWSEPPYWLERVFRVVAEQFPDRLIEDADEGVALGYFNDHPETSFADIELVLEKAAAA